MIIAGHSLSKGSSGLAIGRFSKNNLNSQFFRKKIKESVLARDSQGGGTFLFVWLIHFFFLKQSVKFY